MIGRNIAPSRRDAIRALAALSVSLPTLAYATPVETCPKNDQAAWRKAAKPIREARDPHDGLAAPFIDDADACAEAEGGLQQERHPSLAEEQAPAPAEPGSDVIPGAEDESDEVADRRAMDRLRNLNPLQRAYGINESRDRGDDLLPNL
ncbi:hypothetical protein [Sphingobium naphthae]|uniref:Uncharacterized protein n=1 Tax=Sphingobium naphthae TaxID=1886786 RepID=A0ABU3ZW51_9SPHN|nr:hypothetical protein [Sphingobium naphthae]MDV5823751.1 hypothetical protein [Sphingobium naphthae]